jgi:hypothetical protein
MLHPGMCDVSGLVMSNGDGGSNSDVLTISKLTNTLDAVDNKIILAGVGLFAVGRYDSAIIQERMDKIRLEDKKEMQERLAKIEE